MFQTYHEEFYQLIKRLLKEGAEYNVQNDMGVSPLMVACQRGQKEMVNLLLTQPYIEVHAVDNLGQSALDYAIKQHNFPILDALLHHRKIKVKVVTPDHRLISRLVYAIAQDKVTKVERLLAAEKEQNAWVFALNYVLWCEKEGMIAPFMHAMDEAERSGFIDHAIIYAEKHQVKAALKKLYPVKVEGFMYTVAGPLLQQMGSKPVIDELINTEIWLPDAYTPAWDKIKNQHIIDTFSDWIKVTYITAWHFLLHPVVQKNPNNLVVRLMMVLLSLAEYIKNVEEHTASLFPSNPLVNEADRSFPKKMLNRLARYHLDYCLKLIARHFPLKDKSPAYQFIAAQNPSIKVEGIKKP